MQLGRRWSSWLMPQTMEWIPTLLYGAVLLGIVVGRIPPLDPLQLWACVAALLTLALFDRWVWWRFGTKPAPRVLGLALLARALLIELTVAVEGFEQTAFLYLVLPYRALLGLGVAGGFLAAGAVWTFFSLKLLREDGIAGASQGMLIFALATLWTLVLSQITLREQRARERAELLLDTLQRSHQELEQAHRRLEAYNRQAVALSIAQERNRLARDMHDSVGHALTGLAIQLEKAIAFRPRDATAANCAVETAKGLADRALEEVRQAVGLLRAERPRFLLSSGLRELAEIAQRSGLRVDLILSGDEDYIPLETRMALFRVAQEGLTNVQRHAQAAHVMLRLEISADAICLVLSDDGIGFVPAATPDPAGGNGGGYGLRGIAERVALLGGTYALRSAPDQGTTLEVVAPISEDPATGRMEGT